MQNSRPLCLICRNFIDDPDNMICRAFPDGIPFPILSNAADHRKPYKDDNGIQFELSFRESPDTLTVIVRNAFGASQPLNDKVQP